jgi:hypothetical protein
MAQEQVTTQPIEPPLAAPSRPVNSGWGGSGSCRSFASMLPDGDACQWPYTLWCFLPEIQHGPRGFDLVIGDLPCRVFLAWY